MPHARLRPQFCAACRILPKSCAPQRPHTARSVQGADFPEVEVFPFREGNKMTRIGAEERGDDRKVLCNVGANGRRHERKQVSSGLSGCSMAGRKPPRLRCKALGAACRGKGVKIS